MTRIVIAASAGVTMVTAGAVGLVMEVSGRVLGAQISDGMVVLLAGTALGIGTAIFGFTFKKLMDVLTMLSDLRRDVAVLAKTAEDIVKDVARLEKRMDAWDR